MGTSPALSLSEIQHKAVTILDKNVCVSAGAGSGKTTVLVERFLQIVTQKKISPERIVSITYTDKAANGMKERLVHAFAERGFLEERRALESAYAGTIHSFASRILKENPIEAGIDPDFVVIDNEEGSVLIDETLNEIFEEAASGQAVFDLLKCYGEENLREGLIAIYKRARSMDYDLANMPSSLVVPETCPAWKKLSSHLEKFVSVRPEKASKTAEANLEIAKELLSKILKEEHILTWPALHEWMSLARSLSKKAKAQSVAVDQIKELFEEAIGLEMEKIALPFKKSFLVLYQLFQNRFAAKKAENRFLDFDDLLIKAYKLFTAKGEMYQELRRRYREKFDYILVDEFQDTSRLQARWIQLLTRANNLFIVGDAKQSIYRFRNADLEGFLEKEQEIARQTEGCRLVLNENYRSRPEILDVINWLFEKIWQEDGFCFEKLCPKRFFESKNGPSVELLCIERTSVDEGEDLSMDEARIREARTLAGRLKDIIEGGLVKITERDGKAHEARYGDIAVLFHAMTSVSIYERELREAEIPYFVVRGRGFYEKQEIADLVNFLVILESLERDIPLAAVLRSPLFGLSEDALFWLSRVKQSNPAVPLSKGLENFDFARLGEADSERLRFFLETFEWFRARKDRLRAADILERLVERTHYDAKLIGKSDGRRKYANVLKLIDTAREFETREAFGLSEFIQYVKKLSLQEAKESEAQIGLEKGDAVKLLTIHQAKGLEFPILAVADLGRERKSFSSLPLNFTPAHGLGLQVKNPINRKLEKSQIFLKNKEEEARKDKEELKRIFYVALTRAEEHLILSGVTQAKSVEGKSYHELPTFMEWIRKALGENPPFPVFSVKENALPRRKHERLSLAEMSPFKEAIHSFRPIEELEGVCLKEDSETALKVETLLSGTSPFRKEYYETRDLSVSAFLKYESCPGCYYDFYEMYGLDEAFDMGGKTEGEAGEDETTPLARREFGNFFHRVMQHLDFKDFSGESLHFQLSTLERFLGQEELQELGCSVRNFLGTEWGELIRKSRIHREIPFIYRLSRGMLRGQIDLIAETSGGELVVLDYKTSRLQNREELESKAKEYELQIFIYALALRDIIGVSPPKGVLYFTSLNESVVYNLSHELLDATRVKLESALEAIIFGKTPFAHRTNCPRLIQHECVR